jgi:hypothetical protein
MEAPRAVRRLADTATVTARASTSGTTRRARDGDFYLATSGDLDLATHGDLLMAMDSRDSTTNLPAQVVCRDDWAAIVDWRLS